MGTKEQTMPLKDWEQWCDDMEGMLESLQEIDETLDQAERLTNNAERLAVGYSEDLPNLPGQLKYYVLNHIKNVREGNTIDLQKMMNNIRETVREVAEREGKPVPTWAAEVTDM